ncbi:hypothetical protein FPRO05_09172 [Fusarium proliferatum]|uniref:Uncharacterized protein n=1 Tax=Gibberella intermedia TaxID=948311 RepID=A0A365NGQ6_GIBIN|nr:hypothetical protein FPRO05_09172 [Fusarium proliferatum]
MEVLPGNSDGRQNVRYLRTWRRNPTLQLHPHAPPLRFEPYSRAEARTDLHLSTHRIAVISEFISKLSSIDLISFDNQIKDEIDFAEGLGNTPKWNGPKSAIFCGRRNLLIFSALIQHFAPNTAKAVKLPRLTAKNHPLALKSAFPSLKGLKADLTSFKTRSRTLACMSSNLIQRFNYDFPHLEVLILDQLGVGAFLWRSGRIDKQSQLPNLGLKSKRRRIRRPE